MPNLFSAQFKFAKEDGEIKKPFEIKYTELPREDTWDIADALEAYSLQDELRNNENVDVLEDGLYDCFIAGDWYADEHRDWETGKVDDITIIFDLTLFATKKIEKKEEK